MHAVRAGLAATALSLAALLPAQQFADGKAAALLVFFDDAGPVLIALDVRAKGRPIHAAWDEFLADTFKALDRDGNGYLDRDENQQILPAPMLFSPWQIGIIGEARSADSDGDGKVTRAELAAHYRATGGAPLQLVCSSREAARVSPFPGLMDSVFPSPDALNQALLGRLDADRDGKLTAKELAAAPKLLAKLDTDEDELLTPLEVAPPRWDEKPRLPLLLDGTGFHVAPPPAFVLTTPGKPDPDLGRRLRAKYARGGKLGAAELGLDGAAFAVLDRNGNGTLDDAELARFTDVAPELTLRLDLGGAVVAIGKSSRLRAVPGVAGSLMLESAAALVCLSADPPPDPARVEAQARASYDTAFRDADRDSNGYLDADEARASKFFAAAFPLLDRDGDGRVFPGEAAAFFDGLSEARRRAQAACVTLKMMDEGRNLFELLDADRDGRLSPRDLLNAPRLVARLDRDGDGALSLDELPVVHEGRLQGGAPSAHAPFVISVPPPIGRARPPATGPLWFRKMDRNRDGDVSRREFLGTDAEFRRLDADSDGLVSAAEAIRYDQVHRAP